MKTTFSIADLIRPAIVATYGEDRALQIERACNGALNDVSKDKGPDGKPYKGTVNVKQGEVKWNGQITGGQQYNAKDKLGVKDATWKETEQTVYSVNQMTVPIEFTKFCGALIQLYRKAGSPPSAPLTMACVPKLCVDWFNQMQAKADAKVPRHPGNTRQNTPKVPKTPKTPPVTPEVQNGQPDTAPVGK